MVPAGNDPARDPLENYRQQEDKIMFGWAIFLGIIALVAAILGFGGVAGTLANVAIIIFVIALVGTIVMLALGWKAGKSIVD